VFIWFAAAALAANDPEEPSGLLLPPPPKLWVNRTYLRPRLNLRLLDVNGIGVAQGVLGGEAGLVRQYQRNPHYRCHTRASAVGLIGVPTASLGGDFRIGSFIGPEYRVVRLSIGPDLWYNGYGTPSSEDYWLPWSPGVDVPLAALWKLTSAVHLTTSVTPGWAFDPDRQAMPIGPFHELTLAAILGLDLPRTRLTAGYSRTWNGIGVTDGIILSLSL
jgi:hypothetical protein